MISVVIPTYNHADALPALLESIATQTYRDIEVIVVDDGSDDDPCAVANRMKNSFPFSLVCVKQVNKGAPVARNRGAEIAKGKYFIFTDADIVFTKDAFYKLMKALEENPEASYAYSSFKFGWKKFKGQIFDQDKLRKFNYIHTSALIRSTDFIPFDENLKRFQDWDLWLTLLDNDKHGVFVDEFLFTARVMREGISKWRPSIWYKLWPIFGYAPEGFIKYMTALKIVKNKHNLC
jgi:glycosyltransferase involved in cell wall biosynthesis